MPQFGKLGRLRGRKIGKAVGRARRRTAPRSSIGCDDVLRGGMQPKDVWRMYRTLLNLLGVKREASADMEEPMEEPWLFGIEGVRVFGPGFGKAYRSIRTNDWIVIQLKPNYNAPLHLIFTELPTPNDENIPLENYDVIPFCTLPPIAGNIIHLAISYTGEVFGAWTLEPHLRWTRLPGQILRRGKEYNLLFDSVAIEQVEAIGIRQIRPYLVPRDDPMMPPILFGPFGFFLADGLTGYQNSLCVSDVINSHQEVIIHFRRSEFRARLAVTAKPVDLILEDPASIDDPNYLWFRALVPPLNRMALRIVGSSVLQWTPQWEIVGEVGAYDETRANRLVVSSDCVRNHILRVVVRDRKKGEFSKPRQCCVCFYPVWKTQRQAIPCGHVLCVNCLRGLVGIDRFRCVTCRDPAEYYDGAVWDAMDDTPYEHPSLCTLCVRSEAARPNRASVWFLPCGEGNLCRPCTEAYIARRDDDNTADFLVCFECKKEVEDFARQKPPPQPTTP